MQRTGVVGAAAAVDAAAVDAAAAPSRVAVGRPRSCVVAIAVVFVFDAVVDSSLMAFAAEGGGAFITAVAAVFPEAGAGSRSITGAVAAVGEVAVVVAAAASGAASSLGPSAAAAAAAGASATSSSSLLLFVVVFSKSSMIHKFSKTAQAECQTKAVRRHSRSRQYETFRGNNNKFSRREKAEMARFMQNRQNDTSSKNGFLQNIATSDNSSSSSSRR